MFTIITTLKKNKKNFKKSIDKNNFKWYNKYVR